MPNLFASTTTLKLMLAAALVTIPATTAFAATYQGTEAPAIGKAIAAQLTRYEAAAKNADAADLVANFYTDDIVFVSPDDGFVNGMAEAKPIIDKIFSKPAANLRVEFVKLVPLSKGSAYTLLTQFVNGTPMKSIFVWRLEKGMWKVANDTYMPGKY